MDKPLVSIVTITYNHEPWISMAIEGVLMQKVSFPIEYIIAEDCSTDGTRKICEQYARKYPDIIKLLPSDKNYGAVKNEHRAFVAAKGKYIATCEGDDYWTDPLKLQKQVDFLEAHPEYSVTFHRYQKHYLKSGRTEDDGCGFMFNDKENNEFVEISMYQFMHTWITQYLTMVFRKDRYDFEAHERYKFFRDTHQMYHLLKSGKCGLFNFYGGVYQLTGTGEYSEKDALKQAQMTLAVDEELWKVNMDDGWHEMCAVVMQDIIDKFARKKLYKKLLLGYSFRIFLYTKGIGKLIKNITRIL